MYIVYDIWIVMPQVRKENQILVKDYIKLSVKNLKL